MKRAATPNLDRLGKIEKRFSYASWTSPSHLVFLAGLLPHSAPRRTLASKVYRDEYQRWKKRLEIKNFDYLKFLPELNFAQLLKRYKYQTHAMVSMPVLNPKTIFSCHFDRYELMPAHNQFDKMVEKIEFPKSGRNKFYFLNIGETHYPYLLPGMSAAKKIHGAHGVLRHMGDRAIQDQERYFSRKELLVLKNQQIECIEYLDSMLGKLFEKCPKNTYIIVTSDHGELFGEDGYFGHGPMIHPKVFEVPLVEGMVPR